MRGREVRAVVPDTRLTSPLVQRFLDACAEVLPTELQVPPPFDGS